MTPAIVLGIGVIGGGAAIARFLLDGCASSALGRSFPYGTFMINITGAGLLGLLIGAAVSADTARLAGTGALGTFTTFSTWMLESHRLGEDGELAAGSLNIVLSLALGVAAAALGRQVGGLL